MKIFHTADWHLGKLVQGVRMLEEQMYILEQFIEQIRTEKPDVVIIAGDLYDHSLPKVEAVELLHETMKKIVLEEGVPVLTIAGNHDSATRIQFGSELMQAAGLYQVGHLSKEMKPVVLSDAFGEVHFYLVPFAEPSVVRDIYEDDSITTYEKAMQRIVSEIEKTMDSSKRCVFVGHAFVTSHGQVEENTSESERKLTIGGTEHVSAENFKSFHYTALGHLHQAHFVLNERIQYAGSPLKYSESEVAHKKGYLIVQLDGEGTVTVEKRLLKPNRDVRIVEGFLTDLLQHERSEDYVFVRLLDTDFVKSAIEQVRTVYPNVLNVERKSVLIEREKQTSRINRTKLDDVSLFKSFYNEMTNNEPDEVVLSLFESALVDLLASEREMQEVKK